MVTSPQSLSLEKADSVDPSVTRSPLRYVGLLASAVAIVACTQPWTTIAFPRLWGAGDGPLGMKTEPGFVVLVASALALLLPAFEGGDRQGRRAVAAGSLVAALLALLAALYELVVGPGLLDGVTAEHTAWFWLALAAAAIAGLYALLNGQRYSSSGPPT